MTLRNRLAELGFFLVFVLTFLMLGRQNLFLDPGTFWHVATGRQILTTGLVYHDPFSHTMRGQEWIPSQWLAECVMFRLDEWLGLDGLLWAVLILLGGTYAWVGMRFMRAGCHPLLAGFLVALVVAASCYHFHARPHLISILFLGLTLALLVDVEQGKAPASRLVLLVPLFALWTNLHGGVLAGMGTLGVVGVGWGVIWLFGGASPIHSWRAVAALAVLGAACAGTALMNPYGVGLPRMWHAIMGADLPTIIAEHAPLKWTNPEGVAIGVLAAVYGVILFTVRPFRPRITWLVPLLWLVLAITRVRHGPLFAIAAAVALADMLPYSLLMQALAKRSDLIVLPQSEPPPKTTPRWWLVVPFWLWLIPLPFLVPGLSRGWVELDRHHWPLDLIAPLKHEARKHPVRIFNDDLYGGFLIYFVPEIPVFLDDRCELFAADLLPKFARAYQVQPAEQPPFPSAAIEQQRLDARRDRAGRQLDDWIRAFDLNLALTRSDGAFAMHLRRLPDWELVAETKTPKPGQAVSLFRRKVESD